MRLISSVALFAGTLLLTGTTQAQSFQFTIDQANSDFTWSGTTSPRCRTGCF